jgi:hypothetical protein
VLVPLRRRSSELTCRSCLHLSSDSPA